SYDYTLHERELGAADVNTDSQGNATYGFTVPSPGSIYVKAIVDEDGKEIVNRGGSFWAPDKLGQWSDFQYRDYDEKTIKLVPDKKSYRPGETAHVLAMLPVDNAHLLVTTELSNVFTVRQIDVAGRSIVIDVPIERRFEPNVYLDVSFVKDSDMYNQRQIIAVPARDKMLKLDIVPNKKEFKPRDVASYTIVARNQDGSPAARAVTAGRRVGSGVRKTTARTDVIMRLEMSRFLIEGDTVTISGVVHNFLKSDKSTKISLDISGAQLLDSPSETVTIRQNGEQRVDWRVQANQVGKLTLLAKALTDTESDAVEMT